MRGGEGVCREGLCWGSRDKLNWNSMIRLPAVVRRGDGVIGPGRVKGFVSSVSVVLVMDEGEIGLRSSVLASSYFVVDWRRGIHQLDFDSASTDICDLLLQPWFYSQMQYTQLFVNTAILFQFHSCHSLKF